MAELEDAVALQEDERRLSCEYVGRIRFVAAWVCTHAKGVFEGKRKRCVLPRVRLQDVYHQPAGGLGYPFRLSAWSACEWPGQLIRN